MRTDNLNTSAHDRAHPQMRKYWLVLELQRTELETIRDTYHALLVAAAGDAEGLRGSSTW